jgi:CHAT domain-containing protein
MLDERELAGLGLAYTRIVVLSACGTSRGRARLGVRGLVRAARLSGARSVLGSLWSVDDTATSAWMSAFYAHLARGEGAATSARAAADAVRARWAHPYYWAPFVLIEARPTESLPNVGQRRRG